jgi:peptidoglycan/LPS O-acetylase OafA/YrhL
VGIKVEMNRRIHWKIEGDLSSYLDFIRWGAAVIVVISHIKGLFFADYSQLEQPNILLKIFYAIASAGHQAVMVFFVLSGLFIAANVMKSIDKKNWEWKSYIIKRLTRLYIVLIPALLLGYIWDISGIRMYADTGVYTGLIEDQFVLGYSTVDHSTMGAFLGNLFYLQGILVGHYGSNGPLWSLSYEFWYYILFPCVILSITSKPWLKKIIYLALSIVLCFFIGKQIALYFLVWILGFVIHLLPTISFRLARLGAFLSLFLSISSIIFYRWIPFNSSFLKDFIIACTFALFVYFIKNATSTDKTVAPLFVQWSKFLAGFSYTLYLVHFPFLVFIHAMLYARNPEKWQPHASTLSFGLALLFVTLAYAWLISFFTERQTNHVRRWIEHLANKRRPTFLPVNNKTQSHTSQ